MNAQDTPAQYYCHDCKQMFEAIGTFKGHCNPSIKGVSILLDDFAEIVSQLEQFVADTTEGMECLPTCDSTAHAELCPVAHPVEAWRALRRENTELREQEFWQSLEAHQATINELRRENAELRRDIEQGFMEGAYARLKNLQDAERENAELREALTSLKVVQGDSYHRLNPSSNLQVNTVRAWCVSDEFSSAIAARKWLARFAAADSSPVSREGELIAVTVYDHEAKTVTVKRRPESVKGEGE